MSVVRTVVAILVVTLSAVAAAVPGHAAPAGVRVTGTVADGSGHGWPLYARITVEEAPDAATFTDPATGRYTLDLPPDAAYAADRPLGHELHCIR